MSENKTMLSQSVTPEQMQKQLFMKLSQQYKTPLRTIVGEMEEVVQNTVSTLISKIAQDSKTIAEHDQEIDRLRKLCKDNNIKCDPVSPPST